MTNFKLRRRQLSDAASLAENVNNIAIWNNLRDALPHLYSEEDGRQFIEMVLNKPQPATDMAITVDGEAVGSIGITLHTDVERIAVEIGHWLGENYWTKGIIEVVKQMTKYAFDHFLLCKIYTTPFDFNLASHSQKVLQKAGFEREAILKQAAIKNGKIVDEHYYSFIKMQ